MKVMCPKCNSVDIDRIHKVQKDGDEGFYVIISKCNTCSYTGRNLTFWFENGSAEVNGVVAINKTEREIWENKNI